MKIQLNQILFFTFFLLLISSVSIHGQKIFESKRFNFSMQEPENWVTQSEKGALANIEDFVIDEEKLKEMLEIKKQVLLLASFTKYDGKTNFGLNPKIEIVVSARRTKTYNQFRDSAINNAKKTKEYFEDFQFIDEPTEVLISGIKSVYFKGKYTLKTKSNSELRVRLRVYFIPYKSYMIQASFIDGQIEEDCTGLFDTLVESIKIKQ